MAFSHMVTATSVIALSVMTLSAPVGAQENKGANEEAEIVVTAQRRNERQVDVPISMTTLGNQQLETAGVDQLSDLSRVAPALRFDSTANFVQPSIRGIGTAVASSGGGANVGIYVDGFYSPNPAAADLQLMKVRNVQVLKGPQGTLFGRNTTGGAILITTADPSTTTAGELSLSYGRFNSQSYQGYATFGLTDKVAMDVEGLLSKGDGFTRNVAALPYNHGAFENWSVRTGLKAELSDDVSVLLRYTHSEVDDPTNMNTNVYEDPSLGGTNVGTNQPAGLFTTNPNEFALDAPSRFLSHSDAVQMTVKADLGFANLTSYTQYRTEDSVMVEDLDMTAALVFPLHIAPKDKTISQELLLTSKPGGKLQWTTGLFYFSSKDQWITRLGTATPADPLSAMDMGGSSTTTQSLAAFADMTYEITPDLFLTGGARYSHDVVKDAYYITPFSGVRTYVPDLKQDKVSPRVVIRYKPTARSSVYASYTKGYKAGILDVGGATGNRVAPEDINAFELGYKYDDRAFSIELAGFYYDYKNLQVSVNKGAATAQIINATKSRIYGVEGQTRYRFNDHFEINAGAAWTHGRYRSFAEAPVYTRTASTNYAYAVVSTPLNNVTMQRTPEFTGNIGSRYTADLEEAGKIMLSGNLYYSSKFFFGPSGIQFPQKGYEQLSLRAEWTDKTDRFSLAVYGDNVTNKRYRTQVIYTSFSIGSIWNAPVTYGVSLRAKF